MIKSKIANNFSERIFYQLKQKQFSLMIHFIIIKMSKRKLLEGND